MLFLIEYDRQRGEIVSRRSFSDSNRKAADDARIELEFGLGELLRGREVVLLEAENEDALLLTHGRYFKNVAALANTFGR